MLLGRPLRFFILASSINWCLAGDDDNFVVPKTVPESKPQSRVKGKKGLSHSHSYSHNYGYRNEKPPKQILASIEATAHARTETQVKFHIDTNTNIDDIANSNSLTEARIDPVSNTFQQHFQGVGVRVLRGSSGGKSTNGKGKGKGSTGKGRTRRGKGGKGNGAGWNDGIYSGCLGMTDEELDQYWTYPGEKPKCDYVGHHEFGSSETDSSNNATYYTSANSTVIQDDGGEQGQEGDNNNEQMEDDENSDGQGEGDDYYAGNFYMGAGDEGSDSNPYYAFDIGQCDSYEHLWLWDLALTCGNETVKGDCACDFADQMLNEGYLDCSDMLDCPTGCSVCQTCFWLAGCENEGVPILPSTDWFEFEMFLLLASVVAFLLCSCCFCCVARRRRIRTLKENGELNENLVNSNAAIMPSTQSTWLAPDPTNDHDMANANTRGFVPNQNKAKVKSGWLFSLFPSSTRGHRSTSKDEEDSPSKNAEVELENEPTPVFPDLLPQGDKCNPESEQKSSFITRPPVDSIAFSHSDSESNPPTDKFGQMLGSSGISSVAPPVYPERQRESGSSGAGSAEQSSASVLTFSRPKKVDGVWLIPVDTNESSSSSDSLG